MNTVPKVKQEDPKKIEAVLRTNLNPRGIQVRVEKKGVILVIYLGASKILKKDESLNLIKRELAPYQLEEIESIRISGYKLNFSTPLWVERIPCKKQKTKKIAKSFCVNLLLSTTIFACIYVALIECYEAVVVAPNREEAEQVRKTVEARIKEVKAQRNEDFALELARAIKKERGRLILKTPGNRQIGFWSKPYGSNGLDKHKDHLLKTFIEIYEREDGTFWAVQYSSKMNNITSLRQLGKRARSDGKMFFKDIVVPDKKIGVEHTYLIDGNALFLTQKYRSNRYFPTKARYLLASKPTGGKFGKPLALDSYRRIQP